MNERTWAVLIASNGCPAIYSMRVDAPTQFIAFDKAFNQLDPYEEQVIQIIELEEDGK